MSRKKISSTIYITPEQSERLKLLHERTKVPISVYIREGIDLVLKQYESVLPGQMSLVSEPDVSPLPPPSVPPPPIKKSGLNNRPGSGFRTILSASWRSVLLKAAPPETFCTSVGLT